MQILSIYKAYITSSTLFFPSTAQGGGWGLHYNSHCTEETTEAWRRLSYELLIPVSGRWGTRPGFSVWRSFYHWCLFWTHCSFLHLLPGHSVTGAQHELGEVLSSHWRCSDNEIAATWTCDVFSQSLLPFKITHFKQQCIGWSHS